ncbi:adenylylsulfate kinase [Chitinophaga dinghuensis]|uniref:Adenylyl-sulfate kinase n=1 Tax=Chitinophaga dinghuensis TaxID=1539050 RepID=A0A327VX22_9BACT|nr:adenylyl-sulfate kinase [Chitinophaga dinghuensis]RAJ80022.1 adenylylsulfate kinase [Chitinophaga dinghuensis]
MRFIQLTGLSGAGKTTIANAVQERLRQQGYQTEVIDGDVYRQTLCKDLGFSREDRYENIRRLSTVAAEKTKAGVITLLSVIHPYEEMRKWAADNYGAHTIWIHCPLETLLDRDTKGLYRRALLPDGHPEKLHNLTGVNDPYEVPVSPQLIIHTHEETIHDAVERLSSYILASL